ncbi:unnamed protein product [Amoebophrya sp. A120]|nr:unnamed protein product [Amoebophrya sp. A120]|eukprot:GSA120T00018971001.1
MTGASASARPYAVLSPVKMRHSLVFIRSPLRWLLFVFATLLDVAAYVAPIDTNGRNATQQYEDWLANKTVLNWLEEGDDDGRAHFRGRASAALSKVHCGTKGPEGKRTPQHEMLHGSIMRQAWDTVRNFLIKVHEWHDEHVDMAPEETERCKKMIFDQVQEAVKEVKAEADDLKRSVIDKTYLERKGKYTKVIPAYQWAQNRTHVFLLLKMSARWNAPGALQMIHGPPKKGESKAAADKDPFPSVNVVKNIYNITTVLNFTAFGQISAAKYHYHLQISLFDQILTNPVVNLNSVGKFMLTAEKKHQVWWKQLLGSVDNKQKAQLWTEQQEKEWKLDPSFNGTDTEVKELSPNLCANSKERPHSKYCRLKDKCVLDCAVSCDDKLATVKYNECVGKPYAGVERWKPAAKRQPVAIAFKDTDVRTQHFTGWAQVKVYDWGTLERVEVSDPFVTKKQGVRSVFNVTRNSKREFYLNDYFSPMGALQLQSFNEFGPSDLLPVQSYLTDAAWLPTLKPHRFSCEDLDGRKGYVRLECKIARWNPLEENPPNMKHKQDERVVDILATVRYQLRFAEKVPKRDADLTDLLRTLNSTRGSDQDPFPQNTVRGGEEAPIWYSSAQEGDLIPAKAKYIVALPFSDRAPGYASTWSTWKIVDFHEQDEGKGEGGADVDGAEDGKEPQAAAEKKAEEL